MRENVALTAIILVLCFTLASSGPAEAGLEVAGVWSGVLALGTAELELIFHIELDFAAGYSGHLDVPAQGAQGIPLSFAGRKDGQIVFDVALIAGSFTGEFKGGNLEGIWEQSGLKLPLLLKPRAADQAGFLRPQEPWPPYPYSEEEVVYENEEADIELAGTFTKPFGGGPFPAVILISGSGPQDRNEELMGHKPFLVLADYLTKRGIAVLRFDDRGVGASGGNFAAATTLDFASDVAAGVKYLQAREDVNKKQIGLIGHSEGGLVAPMVAADNRDISFIALLAAPGFSGEEISLMQSELLQRASGAPKEQVEREVRLLRDILAINKEEEDLEKAAELIREAILRRIAELTPQEQEMLGDPEELVQAQLAQVLSPWFRFFQTYDPLPALRQVSCPVLAVNGSKDLQVPAAANLAKIEEALKEGGNETYRIVNLPGLNHLFQTAETGLPNEYMQIEETMSPLALDTIGDWILETLGLN